jgi:hypothetical protein
MDDPVTPGSSPLTLLPGGSIIIPRGARGDASTEDNPGLSWAGSLW